MLLTIACCQVFLNVTDDSKRNVRHNHKINKMKKLSILLIALASSYLGFSQSNKTLAFLGKTFVNSDSAYVSIFVDGGIQGVVSNSEKSSDAVASGALGISVVKKNVIWVASVNIASTTDTISSGFGSIILTPASGKSLTSGVLEFLLEEPFKIASKPIGIHAYASASSSKWLITDTTKASTVFGLGLTFVNKVIDATKGDNSVYLGFEVGPTYRGIFGDISNNRNLYEKALGTQGKHFLGIEGGLKIRFNKITAGIQGFLLYDIENKKRIDGVTSFQITGGITISGAFYQDKFKI